MGIFSIIAGIASGLFNTVETYLKNKAELNKAEQEFKLAVLKAQAEQATEIAKNDTLQRANYIAATSVSFRQGTFYFISTIIIYSILFPVNAEAMWHNFGLIPEWMQYIYIGMLSVTWGLPIAKENMSLMFSSIGKAVESRREYKLEKARINRDAIFADLRKKLFPKGMTQQQVDIIDGAINAGEEK